MGHVCGLQKKETEENRTTKLLDPLVAYRLPLAISKQVINSEQLVIIDSMVFSPDGNYINAAASIEYPSGDKEKLDFYGRKIGFHRGGFIGNAKVELITEPEIKALNNNLDLVFKGDRGKTYVAFDCNGYKEMGVDLEISIPRSIALPVDKNGQIIDGKEKVSARAETVLTDWSELLIEASIPAFQVKGLKDFVFEVHLASFDLSDVANPSSLAFPDGYPEALSPLWRGFFCKEFSLTLPPYFESITGSVPAFSAQNLLIDMHGITGVFNAENLLAFDKGMNLIRMVRRAVKHGIVANYLLTDSWFLCENMISKIRKIKNGAIHILSMCRMDKRKYSINNGEHSAKAILKQSKQNRKNIKRSKKYRAYYIEQAAEYKGFKVKLFFVRLTKRSKWKLLVTTDTSLTFTSAYELYANRWSIEVFFKECKQLLGLEKKPKR